MMVLFGQSSGPVEPLDPQVLSQKGSLFLTRPTLGHYTATRAELLERAGEVLGWVADGSLAVRIGARVPAGAGRRCPPRARGAPHDRQGAAASRERWRRCRRWCPTEWLAERLGRAGAPRAWMRSWYLPASGRDAAAEYAAGHIPGAVFFDLDATSDHGPPLPHMLPPPSAFAPRDGRARA